MTPKETDEGFLFLAEDDSTQLPSQTPIGAWAILIVDEDQEIHTVTRLALNDLIVLGKRLEFHHAYSGQQAIDFLRQHSDTAPAVS